MATTNSASPARCNDDRATVENGGVGFRPAARFSDKNTAPELPICDKISDSVARVRSKERPLRAVAAHKPESGSRS